MSQPADRNVAVSRSIRPIVLVYLIEAIAGFSRGSYLVCFGWSVLVFTGDVAKVGQVFVVSMLTVMLGSHVIGTLVDRARRKYIIMLSHLLIALVMAGVGWVLVDQQPFDQRVFFAAAVAITLGRLAYETALDATLKQVSSSITLTTSMARARVIHLLCTAAATVLTGWCLNAFKTSVAFYLSAASSVILVAAAVLLPLMAITGGRAEKGKSSRDFFEGFRILRTRPHLVPLILLAGLVLPIGQLSNAILSSYVRDDLNLGSWEFGVVDSAWPVGGLLAAFALSVLPSRWIERFRLSVTTGLVAIATILLAQTANLYLLAALHGAMGLFAWMSRILIDARILQAVPDGLAGRAKSNVTFAFSAIAIAMCLSPSLIPGLKTGTYFVSWGAAILVAALLFRLRQWNRPDWADRA